MRRFNGKISLFLVFSLLQFFVPILSVAADLPCCESQEMQCCQKEYPARIVCCIGDADSGLDESVPIQAVLQEQSIPFLSFHIIFITDNSNQTISNNANQALEINLHDILQSTNKLYKKLSTFLN